MDKGEFRKRILSLRKIIPTHDRTVAGRAITEIILGLSDWKKVDTVCLYMSRPDEVDTKELLADLFNHKKTVVLPGVERNHLALRRVMSIKELTRGSYGVLEPRKSRELILPDKVDLFIVPGIAFDRKCNRLGWGKGYYDKLLAGLRATKIGLAYAFQVLAEVPHTSYDVPMDIVVTEEGRI